MRLNIEMKLAMSSIVTVYDMFRLLPGILWLDGPIKRNNFIATGGQFLQSVMTIFGKNYLQKKINKLTK